MDRKQLYWIGGIFAALLALVFFSRNAPDTASAGSLAGIELKTLDGASSVDLGKCATSKCLTVYVSPWCGICRRSTGFIKELKVYLARHDIETRIIVGRGEKGRVMNYAPDFGAGTLIDVSGRYPLQGGVPNFAVSTPSGEVIKIQAGVPGLYDPPVPESILSQMGQYLGLI